jgi:hypothetical protein
MWVLAHPSPLPIRFLLSQMNYRYPVIKAEFYWVFTSVGWVSQGVLGITRASLTENLQISI